VFFYASQCKSFKHSVLAGHTQTLYKKPFSSLTDSLLWDVTVASMLAPSYADTAATGVAWVADQAANMKSAKYADFATSYIFQPIAVENNFGQRICTVSGDDR